MTFRLQINTDNDAFHYENECQEVARLLHLAANKVEAGFRQVQLRDINGNLVGICAFEGTENAND